MTAWISGDTAMIDRRSFLAAIAGAAVATAADAQTLRYNFDEAAIIRPPLDGISKRMSEFAQDGPYIYPSSPLLFNGDDAKYYFFVPRGIKKARLVIFSHGALADPLSYRDLLFHWASHGFIVAAPLHDDAILESGPTLRKTVSGAVSEWDVARILQDPVAWKNRVDRCVECIEIAHEIAMTDGFEIPEDRIVMAGHGYGAYITQLIMGAEVTGPGGARLGFRDDRFFAGLSLSTQGPGIMGLDETSWQTVKSPMLHLLSEGEDDFTGQPWQTRAQAFSLSAPGYKHLGLVINGGTNLFTNGRDLNTDRTITPILSAKAMSACFLKAYGDYDSDAYANLREDFFERNSKGHLIEYTR
jgi:hypothetical protein